MGGLRYCFEEDYVKATLNRSKPKDLAVIDTDGISTSTIKSAVNRGVFAYGYINAGALENGRSYYERYKHLRLAKYQGWSGEYWVDPTAQEWKDHIFDLGKKVKATGAVGVYFDNADIYYEAWRIKKAYSRKLPDQTAVYKSLLEMAIALTDIGLIVMPNGGDSFVRRAFEYDDGGKYIKTINQEGILYEDFKAQPASERLFRTEYVDWAKKKGCYIRGIEYVKTATGIAKCKAYYALHGWRGLYISKHTDLRGD